MVTNFLNKNAKLSMSANRTRGILNKSLLLWKIEKTLFDNIKISKKRKENDQPRTGKNHSKTN